MGEFARPPSPRVRSVAAMFESAGVPARVVDDLAQGRWEKLIWNIPFNGLSAVLDQTTDLLLGSAAGDELVRAIMEEVIAAAKGAANVDLPRSLIESRIELTRGMGPYKTSSHLDMQAGRPMEIEAIFGYPLRRAQQAGVKTPLLWALYCLLRLRDSNRTSV